MNIIALADAWRKGEVLLHPTDTLPGLSFRPSDKVAEAKFMQIKGRPEDKRPISLIADFHLAEKLFAPLPLHWNAVLSSLWPASLSVIWQASSACPRSLVAEDGTIALRMPAWSEDKVWMRELILELDEPFPSSSVNRSGEPHALTWQDALAFVAKAGVALAIPPYQAPEESLAPSLPSTVIRLDSLGGFAMLREGALPRSLIEERLAHARSSQRT